MTMSYILFVNSAILGDAGINRSAVLMATALSSGIATILMGLWTNYPFALAPGMGINAYFAYTVVKGMGIPWQTALGAVFINGIIFLILSILPFREKIIKDVPMNIKLAVSVGIGLFIALIGLQQAGVVVKSEPTMIGLGKITSPGVMLSLFGLIFTAFLLGKKVPGAILIGIITTTILCLVFSVAKPPKQIISLPDPKIFSLSFGKLNIIAAIKLGFILVLFTFTFVDLFDTVGTVIGLTTKLNMIDKTGSFPKASKVLSTDAIGTILGSICGTSTVTTYIESASGIAAGGKTGLTSVVCGLAFLLSLFIWPLAEIIPPQATAPALIIVGLMMIEPILRIKFDDITESLPVFLTILTMPLTYSIANGLIFGVLSYVILKLLSFRWREVSPLMYVFCVLFIIYIFYK